MRRLLVVLLVTLLLDQASKLAIVLFMLPGESVPVFSDFVRITFVRNSGAAFGLLSGNRIPFIFTSTLAIVALLLLLLQYRRSTSNLSVPIVFILAGAVGNMIDRVRLGEVVDFIDLGMGNARWPVFNVADAAVTLGVLLFLYRSVFARRPSQ